MISVFSAPQYGEKKIYGHYYYIYHVSCNRHDTHIFRAGPLLYLALLRRRLGIPRDNAFELLLPGTPKLILTPIFFNRTVKKFISGGIFYPPFPSFPSFSFSLPSFPSPFPYSKRSGPHVYELRLAPPAVSGAEPWPQTPLWFI